MSEKRTHFIVGCEDCTPFCPCCHSCKGLGFDFVKYENECGYHYKAPTSITNSSAIKRLEILGVTGFFVIACRSRVNPKEISLVRQSLKRPAFSEDYSEEEVLTKKFKASFIKEVKIEVSKEVSKELSKLNKKWEQRMLKTEAAQMETNYQLAEHNEQIFGLRKDQDLSHLAMTARDEELKKVIDEFGQRMAQMSKDVKDGIKSGVQDGIKAGIHGIKDMLPQLLPKQPQSITQKKPTQVRNGLASVPSTNGQTRPQTVGHSEPTAPQREFPFRETLGNY